MRPSNPLRLLSALAILAFLAVPIFPASLQNVSAQEDGGDYYSQSGEEEEYVEDEYYEEDYEETGQDEVPDDGYFYEDESEPVAVETTPFDDTVMISERDIVTVNVLANDKAFIGRDTSPRLTELTEPEFGQVTINSDNTITYAPSQIPLPPGYEKTEVITYTASADGISSYAGTITIWIQQVNDAPVAFSANYTIKENVQSTFYLGAHDEDNDSLNFTLITNAEYGTTEIDSGSGMLVYTPLFEFSGKELLTFQVSDESSTSEIGSILINVEEVGGESSPVGPDDDEDEDSEVNPTAGNYQPIADAGQDFAALSEDLVTLDGAASYDIEGDAITYFWSQVEGPEVQLSGDTGAEPTFEAPYVESETEMIFELGVSDGNLTDTASVTVTVVPVLIDIIPNNFQNEIDLNMPEEEVPVAIFGSAALDVSIGVDEESLELGPDTASATRYELLDSNGDGFVDHVSYYRTGDLGLDSTDDSACFSGTVTSVNGNNVKFYTCMNVEVEPLSP